MGDFSNRKIKGDPANLQKISKNKPLAWIESMTKNCASLSALNDAQFFFLRNFIFVMEITHSALHIKANLTNRSALWASQYLFKKERILLVTL